LTSDITAAVNVAVDDDDENVVAKNYYRRCLCLSTLHNSSHSKTVNEI